MTGVPPSLRDEINAAGVAAEVTLLDIAKVFQWSSISDGQGGHLETWTEIGTMPARLVEWRAAQPADVGEAIQARNDFEMVFFPMNHPLGDQLKLRDRIVMNQNGVDTVTIEIQAVEVLGTWGILNRIYGVKV